MALTERYMANGGTASWAASSLGDPAPVTDWFANHAAGERVNWVVDGTEEEDRTTNSDSFSNDGTTTAPMIARAVDASGNPIIPTRSFGGTGEYDESVLPKLNYTTGNITLANRMILEGIFIEGDTHGGAGVVIVVNKEHVALRYCVLDCLGNSGSMRTIAVDSGTTQNVVLAGCDIRATAGHNSTILVYANDNFVSMVGNILRGSDAGNSGFGVFSNFDTLNCIGNIFTTIGTGIRYSVASEIRDIHVCGNTFYDCNGSGAFYADTARSDGMPHIVWNLCWDADRFYSQATSVHPVNLYGNAAGSITSSDQNAGDWAEVGRISLTADPFIDSSNGDFRLNAVEGGGASVRTQGLFGNDLGAIQKRPGGFII